MARCGTVSGVARVANLAFHKAVMVRWTVTDWSTVTEQPAWHVPGSSRDGTDQFQFQLELPPLPAGGRLELCLRFTAGGKDHWYNNEGDNYCFKVWGAADCGGHCDINPSDVNPLEQS
jgi:protein phosphatase 1 regulatory subunit 3A/B/C/D/E